MSADEHSDRWRQVKAHAMDACPVPVKGYALVALGDNGEWYWGASYGLTAREQRDMAHWLGVIRDDVRDALKRGHSAAEGGEAA